MQETGAAEAAEAAPGGWWARARSRWWVRWGMDGLILLAVVWGVLAWQGRDLLDRREAAPPLQLQAMDGSAFDLEALRGREVVVFFWAPWCGVCEAESGAISSLYHSEAESPEGAVVVSVALGYRDKAQVAAFMEEHGVDYPVLLGGEDVGGAYRISKFPTVYMIDAEGRIKASTVGYSTGLGLRARLWL